MSVNSKSYKSETTMNVECKEIDWSDGEGICTDLIKFKDINVAWRVMIHPKLFASENQEHDWTHFSCEPYEQYSLIKVLIEDETNETLDYNCNFECEGDLEFKWDSKFSNSKKKVIYNSSLSKVTKFIERTHEIPAYEDEWDPVRYDNFKLSAQITIYPRLLGIVNSYPTNFKVLNF
ncbi:unnamed protein product [Diamesa serratosioi]